MTIKFNVTVANMNKALDIIGIVDPEQATKQGQTGYLFVMRDGGCDIYCEGKYLVSKSALAVSDLEGSGSFVYPTAFAKVFRHLSEEEVITFEAGERAGTFYVNYETSSGSVAERPSFDPKNLRAFQDEISDLKGLVFPAHLLKRAIDAVKGGMADLNDSKAKEACKGVQIFDGSQPEWSDGDGTMFSSDSQRGCYFYSEAFKGKGLTLYGLHLPKVLEFLSKCSGDVTYYAGSNRSYLVDNQQRMLGWGHHAKTYPRFAYYPEETLQFLVDGDYLRRTLSYMVASLPPGKDRVRLNYDAAAKRLQFYAEEQTGSVSSPLVETSPVTPEAETKSFSSLVSIKHWMLMLESLVERRVRIKVRINPDDPKKMYFRVREDFSLDSNGKVLIGNEGGVKCQLTRFIPSIPKG